MSRIGRKPIVIPTGVEVKIDGSNITVKGPKGTLDSKIHPMMTAKVENGEVVVTRPNDEKEARSLHGLTDRKSTRLNSSHRSLSRMPSSA